jgi:hypothetical protein
LVEQNAPPPTRFSPPGSKRGLDNIITIVYNNTCSGAPTARQCLFRVRSLPGVYPPWRVAGDSVVQNCSKSVFLRPHAHRARKQKRIKSPTSMIDARPNSLSSFLFRQASPSSPNELLRIFRDLNYLCENQSAMRIDPDSTIRPPDYCFKTPPRLSHFLGCNFEQILQGFADF